MAYCEQIKEKVKKASSYKEVNERDHEALEKAIPTRT